MTRPAHISSALAFVTCTFVAAIIALGAPLVAEAQSGTSVRLVMSASPTRVPVGSPFELSVRAEVSGRDVDDIKVPDLSDFEIRSRSVSRPLQFRFGSSSGTQIVQSTTVHSFVLIARTAGAFELEPAVATVGGVQHRSNRVTVIVGNAAAPNPAAVIPNPQQQQAVPGLDGAVYDDTAFVRTVVDKAEPFIGEQVTATVYLYSRGGIRRAPTITREATADGFWVHNLLPPGSSIDARQQVVNGVPFRVYTLRRFAAFPLRAGELTIGSIEMNFETGTLFDMFQSPQQIRRVGQTVTVRAKELPATARDSVVGRYTVASRVDRTSVRTGDAVTLTATVRGTGNIRDVRLQLPDVPGIRALQPRTEDRVDTPRDLVGGERTVEWILVVEQPGEHTLPPLTLKVFNPQTESIETVRSQAITLTAAGAAVAPPPTTAGQPDPGGAQPAPEITFGPIRNQSELNRGEVTALSSRSWFPFALAFPPLLWLGLLVFRAQRKRIAARPVDEVKRAQKAAQRRLSEARAHAKSGDSPAFYGEIAKAIESVLEGRLGEAVGGITHTSLAKELSARGMEGELVKRIIDELESCDFARFSAAGGSSEEMERCLGRTKALLSRVDKFQPIALLLLCLACGWTNVASAQPISEVFESANASAFQGNWGEAATTYEELLEAGVHDADVHFNLGTAYANDGKLGRAVLSFSRALEIDPGDDDASLALENARAAIGRARAEAEGEATIQTGAPFLDSFVEPISERSLSILVILLNALCFFAFIARMYARKENVRVGLAIGGVLLAVCLVFASVGLVVKSGVMKRGDAAIVLDDQVALREGPDPEATSRGEAREGESARVLGTDGDYVRVELSSGRAGWASAESIGRI